MTRKSKLWMLAMTVCALLLALPCTAAAIEPEGTEELIYVEADNSQIFQNGGLSGPQTMPSAEDGVALLDANTDALYTKIYQGLIALNTKIDLEGSGFTLDQSKTIYAQVINDHPELFYVNTCRYWSYSDGSMAYIEVIYDSELAKPEIIQTFSAKVDSIIAETIETGMSDLEKALALHDYLVLHCAYNWEVATTGSSENKNAWSAYGALVQGDAVCQGYALAYKLLLNRVGIDAGLVTSHEAMNHAWNWVKLGEYYYHVDVTWDDATPNTEGRCGHTYFLLSDATISDSEHVHTGWDAASLTCNSEQYESGWVFCSSRHSIYRRDGAYYYINSSGEYALYKTSALNTAGTKVAVLSYSWHSGYGVAWVNGDVYYVPNARGTQRTLKACSLDSGKITEIGTFGFTATAVDKYPESNDYIGLRIDDTGKKIEAVSSTRREVLYSADIRDYPLEWDSLTLASGEQAKLAGLFQSDDGTLKAGVLLSDGVSGQAVLCAAFYDSNHKMTALRWATVYAGSDGILIVTFDGGAPAAYETVSLFLTDGNYTPLCGKCSST